MRIGSKESITNLLLSFYLIWMVTVTANSQTLEMDDGVVTVTSVIICLYVLFPH